MYYNKYYTKNFFCIHWIDNVFRKQKGFERVHRNKVKVRFLHLLAFLVLNCFVSEAWWSAIIVRQRRKPTKTETNTRILTWPSFLKRTRTGHRICLFQTAALTNTPHSECGNCYPQKLLNIHYIRNDYLFINLLVTFSCISHATLSQISASKTVLMVAMVFIRPFIKQNV